MPPPKKGNRKNKKRRNYKKNPKPKALSLGPYMPQSIIAKHKFSTIFALSQDYQTTTIGDSNMHNFKLNALSDPDLEGQGVPRFFDEMHTFYQTYRVIGAKVRLKFINLSGEPAYVHAYVGTQQFSANTGWKTQDLNELKGVRRRIVHSLDSGAKSVASMTIPYSPERVEGKSRAVIRGDPNFESLGSGDPAEPHYLSIVASQVSSTLGGQANLNIQVEVQIDFTAIWNDRKIQSGSS